MKKGKKNFVSRTGRIAALIISAAILPGCARVLPNAPNEAPAENDSVGDLIAPVHLAEAADAGGWRKFQDQRFDFLYPPSWQLRVEENSFAPPGRAKHRIQLKSANQEIVLGAVAPDDYYLEQNGTRRLNSEKYAGKFAAIAVDVYEGGEYSSWPAFFNKVYPDVDEFENCVLPARPELDAMSVRRVSGIFAGDPRIFIRANSAVYDIALFCRDDRCDEAMKILNAFILNFTF